MSTFQSVLFCLFAVGLFAAIGVWFNNMLFDEQEDINKVRKAKIAARKHKWMYSILTFLIDTSSALKI